MKTLKKIIDNIKSTAYNTYLCIKYPFLYPRNRFTGKHYNNWKINDIKKKLNNTKKIFITIDFINNSKFNIIKDNIENNVENSVITDKFTFDNKEIMLFYNKDTKLVNILVTNDTTIINEYTIDLHEYLNDNINNVDDVYFYIKTNNNIVKENRNTYSLLIVCNDNSTDENVPVFKFITVETDKYVNIKLKVLNIIENIIGIFHCIPTYTELDALDKGWRTKFGNDICKEIKHSLIYTYISKLSNNYSVYDYIKAYIKGIKLLYDYRITQIKEKWGQLEWYDSYTTDDIQNIINKYQDISYNTCIVCGKKAVYRTNGYILPYCENHISVNDIDYAEKI